MIHKTRIDNKNLWELYDDTSKNTMYLSYETPVIIVENDTFFICPKWYSTTTTGHINYVRKTLHPFKKYVEVPIDAFRQKAMKYLKLNTGRL